MGYAPVDDSMVDLLEGGKMTKKQKEFIDRASKTREHELYRDLYIADKGTLYNGFFGKNGYNNMVIIGETEDGRFELITDHSDHFGFFDSKNMSGINIDIANSNGFIRMWMDRHLFRIPIMVNSSCLVYSELREQRKGK